METQRATNAIFETPVLGSSILLASSGDGEELPGPGFLGLGDCKLFGVGVKYEGFDGCGVGSFGLSYLESQNSKSSGISVTSRIGSLSEVKTWVFRMFTVRTSPPGDCCRALNLGTSRCKHEDSLGCTCCTGFRNERSNVTRLCFLHVQHPPKASRVASSTKLQAKHAASA